MSFTDEILNLQPDVMAFRVLAYLLLGAVRIFTRQVDDLLNHCNTNVFSEVTIRRRTRNSVTLPRSFELDAFDLEILEKDDRYDHSLIT